MTNIILIIVILAILAGAIAYIVKEKKKGVKCVGCPHAKECANRGKCNGNEKNS